MTITRILPAVLLTATLAAGPAPGQPGPLPPGLDGAGPAAGPASPELPADAIPSMLPVDAPPEVPASATPGPLERVSATAIPGASAAETTPLNPAATLAGRPAGGVPGALPPGAYASPWYSDAPGCCGPLGANGPVGYELYLRNGANFIDGGSGDLATRLNTGYMINGGGKTLLYNAAADAAWVLDLGLSYTYNRGLQNEPLTVFNKGTTTTNVFGQSTFNMPTLQTYRLRGLSRTSLNYGLGRDWFVWGPGAVPLESGWNLRFGVDVGGRYGTAHVDMLPINETDGYFRRQKIYHGLYGAVHTNVEVPLGGYIWTGGLRLEYGRDWTNLIPPLDGDIDNINLLLTTGIRF